MENFFNAMHFIWIFSTWFCVFFFFALFPLFLSFFGSIKNGENVFVPFDFKENLMSVFYWSFVGYRLHSNQYLNSILTKKQFVRTPVLLLYFRTNVDLLELLMLRTDRIFLAISIANPCLQAHTILFTFKQSELSTQLSLVVRTDNAIATIYCCLRVLAVRKPTFCSCSALYFRGS